MNRARQGMTHGRVPPLVLPQPPSPTSSLHGLLMAFQGPLHQGVYPGGGYMVRHHCGYDRKPIYSGITDHIHHMDTGDGYTSRHHFSRQSRSWSTSTLFAGSKRTRANQPARQGGIGSGEGEEGPSRETSRAAVLKTVNFFMARRVPPPPSVETRGSTREAPSAVARWGCELFDRGVGRRPGRVGSPLWPSPRNATGCVPVCPRQNKGASPFELTP